MRISGGPGSGWLYVVGSGKDEPDVRCVYLSLGLGDRLYDVARDVPATAGVVSLLTSGASALPVYLATEGRGLLCMMRTLDPDRQYIRPKPLPIVGSPDAYRFLSFGTTYGPNADIEALYVYEPAKLGLALARREIRNRSVTDKPEKAAQAEPEPLHFDSLSEGLYTGPFVKEGSTLRANANGGMFYAVINNSLYVGRRVENGVNVADVTVKPPLCVYGRGDPGQAFGRLNQAIADFERSASVGARAKDLIDVFANYRAAVPADSITITAKIAGEEAPAMVSADLTRIMAQPDSACRMPLFDDGLHGDGAATDGVYGVTVPLTADAIRNDGDWRRPVPGPLGLTVSAVGDVDGSRCLSGGVGVLGVFPKLQSRTFAQVDVARDWKDAVGLEDLPLPDDSQAHPGKLFVQSLEFGVKDKAWELPIGRGGVGVDSFVGYYVLSFWIRSDKNTGKEVGIRLRDSVIDALPNDGPKLALLKDGLMDGGAIDPTWRRVTVPISRLLGGAARLATTSIGAVVLSGDGGAPQTFWISDLVLYASPEDHQDALKPKGVTP